MGDNIQPTTFEVSDGIVFDSDNRIWYWLDIMDGRLYVMVKREGYGKVAEPYKKVKLIGEGD